MRLIDTHCHIYLKEFAEDLAETLQRAEKEGVERFYLPAIDSAVAGDLLALEERYPGKCVAMMGLHPCSVRDDFESELKLVEGWLSRRKFAAVGEIGLDFHWSRTHDEQQYVAFRRQIGWALQYDLPIVIHSRESMPECIEVVREQQDGKLRGLFHCWSGSLETAQEIIGLGFYLGIGGVLTYKKSGLAEVLKEVSLEHIVLETDAPYLSPVPFRGKRNEPGYLRLVAAALAAAKGVEVEEVARVTTANAQKIFGG